MKLVINYDFFNAIRDVNGPATPLKIIRNEKHYLLYNILWPPTAYMWGFETNEVIQYMLLLNSVYMAIDYAFVSAWKKIHGVDKYTYNASVELKKLPALLDTLNVKTDYDMLLKSELYERKYKLESSESGIVPFKEEKYIYVPSYGFDGKEKETSILQEHNLGSSRYILSVAEPEKRYRRVLVNNNA